MLENAVTVANAYATFGGRGGGEKGKAECVAENVDGGNEQTARATDNNGV